jgi:hypothetical protein
VDQMRFDDLTRALTHIHSRRQLLRGLVAAGLGLGTVRRSDVAIAKKKHKHKHTKRHKAPQPNAYGCLEVEVACTSADECCSGICEGATGNKTCRAHDTGDCRPGDREESCAASGFDIRCTTSTGDPSGYCDTTTGNAAYCVYDAPCFPCRKDLDCQAFCGPQAACIRCDSCPEGTACAAPGEPGCTIE